MLLETSGLQQTAPPSPKAEAACVQPNSPRPSANLAPRTGARSPPALGSGSRPSARDAFSSCGAAAPWTPGPTAVQWGRLAPAPSAWQCAVGTGRCPDWAVLRARGLRTRLAPDRLRCLPGVGRSVGVSGHRPLSPAPASRPRLRPRAHGVSALRAPGGARPRRRRRHVRVHRVGGGDHRELGARRPAAETRRPRPHPTGRSGGLSSYSGPLLPRPRLRQTPPY